MLIELLATSNFSYKGREYVAGDRFSMLPGDAYQVVYWKRLASRVKTDPAPPKRRTRKRKSVSPD